VFARPPVDLAKVEPENPTHAATLHAADALLKDPRIRALENRRREELRSSFARAERRLISR
jgi:hypothetical protein